MIYFNKIHLFFVYGVVKTFSKVILFSVINVKLDF